MIGVGSSGCDDIAVGEFHSVVLKSGAVYACGYGFYGQLGVNGSGNSATLIAMVGQGTSGCTAISANWQSTIVLKGDAVYGCGNNSQGQLGDNTTSLRRVLTAMIGQGTSGCTAISSGNLHTIVLKGDAVYGCGFNGRGQLGDNTTTNRPVLTAMVGQGTSGCTEISTSLYHTLVLKGDAVYACGSNVYGQLGDNTTTQRNVLTAMVGQGTSGCSKVAAGGFHSLVIKNGAVYACGLNGTGQLGDGTTTNRSVLTSMIGFGTSGCTQIYGGCKDVPFGDTVVLKYITPFTCGYNASGQLADNTIVNKSQLVQCIFAP
jgi:alpha-tubulin suppressor-like RCC1 family protein